MRADQTDTQRTERTRTMDPLPAQNGSKKATKQKQRAESPVKSRRQLIRERARASSAEKRDDTPRHIPGLSDLQKPLTLREEMQRFIRQEISRRADQHGEGSFEEEDDFEIDETEISLTKYAVSELTPEETPAYPLEPTAETPPTPPAEQETPEESTGAEGTPNDGAPAVPSQE